MRRVFRPRKGGEPPWPFLQAVVDRVANRFAWVDRIPRFDLRRADLKSDGLFYAWKAWKGYDAQKSRVSLNVYVYTVVYQGLIDRIRSGTRTIRIPKNAKGVLLDRISSYPLHYSSSAYSGGPHNFHHAEFAIGDRTYEAVEAKLLLEDMAEFVPTLGPVLPISDPRKKAQAIRILQMRLGLSPYGWQMSLPEIKKRVSIRTSRIWQIVNLIEPAVSEAFFERYGMRPNIRFSPRSSRS